jgi:ubiquinone/menaquinone biosynthesis C-methylase UbiE
MSRVSSRFFSYVQSAAFYRELHGRAVQLLPSGEGRIWFDVGTGPGLVARDASAHGYRTTGFDVDKDMVERAREISRRFLSPAEFQVAGIDELPVNGRKADVVSAASLLAVLNDKEEALHRLMACVNDGGTLLIIETTNLMKPGNAWGWLRKNGFGKRNWVLLLWAWARRQGPAVSPLKMQLSGYQIRQADVFEGLVNAWLIRRDN